MSGRLLAFIFAICFVPATSAAAAPSAHVSLRDNQVILTLPENSPQREEWAGQRIGVRCLGLGLEEYAHAATRWKPGQRRAIFDLGRYFRGPETFEALAQECQAGPSRVQDIEGVRKPIVVVRGPRTYFPLGKHVRSRDKAKMLRALSRYESVLDSSDWQRRICSSIIVVKTPVRPDGCKDLMLDDLSLSLFELELGQLRDGTALEYRTRGNLGAVLIRNAPEFNDRWFYLLRQPSGSYKPLWTES